jgi:hypothetical protein
LGKCDGFGGKDKKVGEDVIYWVQITINFLFLFCFEILSHKLRSNVFLERSYWKLNTQTIRL